MRVFISWSGPLSQEVADMLRRLLPCMIQGLDVFLSRHDIQSGERWGIEIARELEETSFGILCLTAENKTAPWLLYEAGALTKQLEGKACGLLLGELTPANVTGPLAQFQHRRMEKTDFFRLVCDLNKGLDQPLHEDQIKLVFEKWWPDLQGEYETAVKAGRKSVVTAKKRPDRELLEELLERVRTIGGSPRRRSAEDIPISYVQGFVQRILRFIPDSERSLLRKIVILKRTGTQDDVENLVKDYAEDFEGLIDRGLIFRNKQNLVKISKTLAASSVIELNE